MLNCVGIISSRGCSYVGPLNLFEGESGEIEIDGCPKIKKCYIKLGAGPTSILIFSCRGPHNTKDLLFWTITVPINQLQVAGSHHRGSIIS